MHLQASQTVNRLGLPLLAALCLLPAAGCFSDQRVDLRRPACEVGQVFRDESKLTMTNAAITITGGGRTETGQLDLLGEGIYEEEILAVADGDITKSRLKIVSEPLTETLRSQGETDTHTEPSPLQGETIEFQKIGGDWKRTLVGKTPDARQAEDLQDFPPPESFADWYPAEPVSPGHRWTVDVHKLRKFFGPRVHIDSGQWKKRLEKKFLKDGKPYALIAEELEVHGKYKDGKGERQFDWKAAGVCDLPLRPGGVMTLHLTGIATEFATVVEGGESLQVRISGSMTLERKSSRKGK
jgi:hypothetical protein